jgi:asparagine synthase (glutamine-hydrolysing)
MCNEYENIWIVFNGEIYNHEELRKELQALGRKFKTDHSDTEVIIKGYEQWGVKVLEKLRGMFAFALWDKTRKRLWIARDRMGVKPLYYTQVNGVFAFASEIKALLEIPGVKRECHERAFHDFLTFLVSPAPQTLFKNIYKLQPGHSMMIEENGRQSLERFWHPFSGVTQIENRSEKEWTEAIVHSLRESIRYRMVSDVKFGVFLSGGIDSSTNVALMAEQMSQPVETFSIGFEGAESFNELEYARLIAKRYNTNHHETILTKKDFIRFLPQLVFHQDEPIVDPVCVPVYYVAKLAKDNGTTVCQVGEGSDELFCGYPHWGRVLKFEERTGALRLLPAPLRKLMWNALSPLTALNGKMAGPMDRLRRVAYGQRVFWGGAEAFSETHKAGLLSDTFRSRLGGYSSYETIRAFAADFEADAPDNADELHWMTYLDLRFRLPELLLMRVDKMTMATAVEARVPFLDQEFIRLAMSMPKSIKYKNQRLKHILKEAVEPILPHDVIHRKKQGFGVPVDAWFKESLQSWSNEKIRNFAGRTDYFSQAGIERFLSSNDSTRSWFLLNFVLWHERWIENKDLALPIN